MELELKVSSEARRIVQELFPFAECRAIQTKAGLAKAVFSDPDSSAKPLGGPQPCDSAAWISAALWHEEAD